MIILVQPTFYTFFGETKNKNTGDYFSRKIIESQRLSKSSTDGPKTNSSVLILSTYQSINTPLIANLNGTFERNTLFKIDENANVHDSCSLLFNGEFYVFGSWENPRQIAKVNKCSLKRVGILSFDLNSGGCTNMLNQIFLCFDWYADGKTCFNGSSPLGGFKEITKTTNEHRLTRLASSECK